MTEDAVTRAARTRKRLLASIRKVTAAAERAREVASPGLVPCTATDETVTH